MPLRLYVPPPPDGVFDDPEAAIRVVREAAEAWKDVVRPGVPDFTVSTSRWSTDLYVRWVDEPLRGHAVGLTRWRRRRSELRAGAVSLATHWTADVPVTLEVLARVAAHEIGHALGMIGHSPDSGDLMFCCYERDGQATTPSPRDRETLRLLYGFEPGQLVSEAEVP